MYLYSQIPAAVALELANKYQTMSPVLLRRQHSDVEHIASSYTPTGGNKVTNGHLKDLQQKIRDCANRNGFPNPPSTKLKQRFDAESGRLLHEMMIISPSEASKLQVWYFFSCVLLPDVVRWRFYGRKTSTARFLGESRGARRNTFGRLWWRAYILHNAKAANPYDLLFDLTEDELVQISERASILGRSTLARTIGEVHLISTKTLSGRRDYLRDVMKRIRRLVPVVIFEALTEEEQRQIVEDLYATSIKTLN